MASKFTLALLDKLSGPARGMVSALDRLFRSEERVSSASDKVNAATARTGAAMGSAAAKAMGMARAFEMAARAQDKFRGKAFKSWSAPLGPVLDRGAQDLSIGDRLSVGASGLMKWNRLTGDSIDKWKDLSAAFAKTPLGMIAIGLGKIGGVLLDLIGYMGSALLTAGKLSIALGAIAAIGFTKMVVEMGAFAERSKSALGFITGSGWRGNREFKDAVQLAKDLGTNVQDTVLQYSKLRSMQFSDIESAGLVRLSTDLKAITGDSQAAERALTAMTQIKAKGKLQSEELVGQLAEAGVSTVLVYEELAKMLGTDRKGVLSKLQSGSIDSETGLVAVVRALKQKYHVSEVGLIGERFADETIGGLWESIKNAPARMFMRIGEQIDSRPLVAGLKTLRDAFENAFSGGNGVSFVNAMVAGLSKLIPLTVAFAEGFGTGLEKIAAALSFGDSANVAQWAREAGASTATFFAKVIEFARLAIPVLLEAGDRFLSAFDTNKLLDSLNKIDFKQLGADMVVIADALGKIMHFAASLLGSDVVTGAAHAIANPGDAYMDTVGGALKRFLGFGEHSIFDTGEPEAPPPLRADPRVDPALLSKNMTNHITIPVSITAGGGSPEEHAAVGDSIAEQVTKALRKFTDHDLAQATG